MNLQLRASYQQVAEQNVPSHYADVHLENVKEVTIQALSSDQLPLGTLDTVSPLVRQDHRHKGKACQRLQGVSMPNVRTTKWDNIAFSFGATCVGHIDGCR